MARLQINCDFGIFVTSSTGHLGSTKNCAPCSDHHVRTRAFIINQLRSLSRSRRNHPWSSGAQRQHCPQATVLFFWTANSYLLPAPPRVSLSRSLWWNCAELSLQQPWKILLSSDGAISGNPRYTG